MFGRSWVWFLSGTRIISLFHACVMLITSLFTSNYDIYRRIKSALSWFLCGSSGFVELDFAVLVLWRDENQRNWRKTLGASRKPTRYSTHIWHGARIKPGSHEWEVSSTLTTGPFLLPTKLRLVYPRTHLFWLFSSKLLLEEHEWVDFFWKKTTLFSLLPHVMTLSWSPLLSFLKPLPPKVNGRFS